MTGPVLHAVKTRIQTGWTQEALALNEAGQPVEPWHPEATRWDLLGAVVAAVVAVQGDMRSPLRALRQCLPKDYRPGAPDAEALAAWDNMPGRTRDEVLALLDRALAQKGRE